MRCRGEPTTDRFIRPRRHSLTRTRDPYPPEILCTDELNEAYKVTPCVKTELCPLVYILIKYIEQRMFREARFLPSAVSICRAGDEWECVPAPEQPPTPVCVPRRAPPCHSEPLAARLVILGRGPSHHAAKQSRRSLKKNLPYRHIAKDFEYPENLHGAVLASLTVLCVIIVLFFLCHRSKVLSKYHRIQIHHDARRRHIDSNSR